MAETMAGDATINVNLTNTNTVDLSTILDNVKKTYNINFTNGAGANKAEAIFHDTRQIAASATDQLDLSGALTNKFGTTVVFTKIKGIFISAASGNTNDVHFKSTATNGFVVWCLAVADGVVIQPGGMFMLVTPSSGGYTVTAGTGDLVDMINSSSGSTVDYDIIIWGETT